MNREAEEFRISSDIKEANNDVLRGRLEQAEALLKRAAEICTFNTPDEIVVLDIEAFLASQQGEHHSCKNCLGVDPESCMFKHPEQAEGAQGEREAFEAWCAAEMGVFADDVIGAEGSDLWACWKAARAALAQPSPKSGDYSDQEWVNAGCPHEQPSPAPELELPEVVAWVQPISGMNEFFRSEADAIAERAEYLASFEPEPEDLELKPEALIRLADFDRIVGALRAEIEKFKAANGEISSKLLGRRMAVIRLKAENATLREERDAAQARVAELEKQEPVGYVWPDELAAESRGNPTGFVASRIPHPRMLPLYANPAAQAGQAPEEVRHWSDCATNNRGCPELLGPCDCGGYKEGDA